MDASRSEARHPMRVVAQRTGLSPHVLRAWERRYRAVTPGRSEGGRRLYSDADIERFLLIRRATSAGHSIGMVAALSDDELQAMAQEVEEYTAPSVSTGDGALALDPQKVIDKCWSHINDLDSSNLEHSLRRAAVVFGTWDLLNRVIIPLIHEIGERWHGGQISTAHEHLASGSISRVLAWVLQETTNKSSAPILVVATPSGERHELGAMMAAATAAMEGWRVVYLGPDLPGEDIANAARDVRATAVALSVVYPETDASGAITEIRDLLPRDTALIIGGVASSPQVSPGVHVLENLDALPPLLGQLSPA
jgi:methanogenic corrinoid protein MtbC1